MSAKRNLRHLLAVGLAAIIFAPWRLLRVAEQILTGDMVVVADLGAAHAAEKFPAQFVQAPSSE